MDLDHQDRGDGPRGSTDADTAPCAISRVALERLRAAIGDAHVIVDPDALAAAERATFATSARIPAILRPADPGEVQRCLVIAAEEGVAVYPVSRGKNWGLGSRVPTRSGACLLDLGRLARIVDYDPEMARVTVEPGVTFGQLAAFLRAQGGRHFLSTTGSTPASSVIGNTLERGDGVGPLGDRVAHVCALEVLLTTGERLETGFARYPGATPAHDYRWGVGPWLDGLFAQSNLGVVTRMTLWLTPTPAVTLAFRLSLRDPAGLGRLGEAIRTLRLEGTLRSLCALWNDFRVLSTRVNLPWSALGGRTHLDRPALADLPGGAPAAWYGMGAVYAASPALAAAARARIAEVLAPLVDDLVFHELRAGAAAATVHVERGEADELACFGSAEAAFAVLTGHPQEASLQTAYYRKAATPPVGDRDLDRDGCGVLWSCPVVPLRAAEVARATALCEAMMLEHGFEPMLALLAQHDRSAYLVPILIYDRDAAGEDARARACHDALLAALIAAGFPPYRLGVQSMGALPEADDDSAAVLGRIKRALDPSGVLAPGRYAPPER